jgi:hypothetical protein
MRDVGIFGHLTAGKQDTVLCGLISWGCLCFGVIEGIGFYK